MDEILKRLFDLKDEKYAEFQRKLIPTVAPDTVIGIRTPVLRSFAKEISKTPLAEKFMSELPHSYYDENALHGFLIETMKDYDACIKAIDEFLPYVDNWAVCDSMSPKVFKKHKTELLSEIKRWISSKEPYTIRFGIEALMTYYLDEDFSEEYLSLTATVKSDEYYVKMMVAWFFATALAKQYDAALPYINEKRLDVWTHNKAIQKAVESYRITDEQKLLLKTMKIR